MSEIQRALEMSVRKWRGNPRFGAAKQIEGDGEKIAFTRQGK